jgi:hypothetical protein
MLPLPKLLAITLPTSWYVSLPLGTWFIYLADHVLDVTRKKQAYPSPRHQFIKRNLKSIITLMLCISVVMGWYVLHPFSYLLFTVGCTLAVCVAIHLIIVRINPTQPLWYNNKELAIAIIYAAGMYLAPILLLHQQNKSITFPIYCALLLATIAFINLLLISIIELQWDEEMDNTSLVRVLGLEYSKSLFLSLQLICTLSITVLLFLAPTAYAPMLLSYLMISLGHLFIYTKRATLNHNLAYRKLSEALFWLPFMAYFFYL